MNQESEGLMTMKVGKAEGALQLFDILSDNLDIHDRNLRNNLVSLKSDFTRFLNFMKKGD